MATGPLHSHAGALDAHNGALSLIKLSSSASNAASKKRSLTATESEHGPQQPALRSKLLRMPARRLEAFRFTADIASLLPLPPGSAGLRPTPNAAAGSSLPAAQAFQHQGGYQPGNLPGGSEMMPSLGSGGFGAASQFTTFAIPSIVRVSKPPPQQPPARPPLQQQPQPLQPQPQPQPQQQQPQPPQPLGERCVPSPNSLEGGGGGGAKPLASGQDRCLLAGLAGHACASTEAGGGGGGVSGGRAPYRWGGRLQHVETSAPLY